MAVTQTTTVVMNGHEFHVPDQTVFITVTMTEVEAAAVFSALRRQVKINETEAMLTDESQPLRDHLEFINERITAVLERSGQ